MATAQSDEMAACRRNCWIAAALLGVAVMGVVQALIGWHWTLSLIVGLIAAGIVGWLLPAYFCIGADANTHANGSARPAAAVEPGSGAALTADTTKASAADSTAAPKAKAKAKPAAASAAPKDKAAGWTGSGASLRRAPGADSNVGNASYSYTPQEKPAPKQKPAPAPAAEVPAEDAPAAAAPAAPQPAPTISEPKLPAGSGAKPGSGWGGTGGGLARSGADAAVTPSKLASAVDHVGDKSAAATTPSALADEVSAGRGATTPAGLKSNVDSSSDAPRTTPSELAGAIDAAGKDGGDRIAESKPKLYTSAPADADNLKEIKGVGPGIEKTLNEMGIYTFAQVASWGEAEIAWVDARLKFKGRIVRDGWVAQAAVLASGGETEFSKRVDKGDVY